MTRIALLAPFALMASPALAHSGAHLHPHGFEVAIIGGAAFLIASAITYLKSR